MRGLDRVCGNCRLQLSSRQHRQITKFISLMKGEMKREELYNLKKINLVKLWHERGYYGISKSTESILDLKVQPENASDQSNHSTSYLIDSTSYQIDQIRIIGQLFRLDCSNLPTHSIFVMGC
jgi:hypothetical protein